MIVGLTGGIGSGKTTVATIFEQLNVPVYYADEESKKLIDTDTELQKALVQLLGEDVIENGKIVRPKMASLIFNDDELLEKTNKLIHPAVASHFKQWYKTIEAPYIIREAAILFESGSYKDCDFVITVFAPKETRIKRVVKRNNTSREEVLSRMDKQWDDERKLKLADFVIDNSGEESVIKQVLSLHENLISQANTITR